MSPQEQAAFVVAAQLTRRERVRAIKFCEIERFKVLAAKDDPSWTEHFANIQNDICGGQFDLIQEAHNELTAEGVWQKFERKPA